MRSYESDKGLFLKANNYLLDKNYLQAESIYSELLTKYPKKESLYYNLALIYLNLKKYEKGISILLKFIKFEKKIDDKFCILLSVLYEKNKNIIRAIRYLKINYNKNPEKKGFKISKLYKKIDQIELSNKYLDKCYDISNNKFYNIYKLFNFPIIYDNNDFYEKKRNILINSLKNLINENFTLTKNELIDNPIFLHTYNNFDNAELNSLIKDFFVSKYDFLKKVYKRNENKEKKIKLGIISEFLSFHTIGKIFSEIIINLDKSKYEVIIFHSKYTIDSDIKTNIDSNFKSITLPSDQEEKIKIILDQNINILFYPDIGMSTDLFYITYLKLADKQIVSWGHPDTTGNKNIDYFISSKYFEEGDQNLSKNYTEKLIKLNFIPTYFNQPNIIVRKRKTLKNVYCCPQSIYKFHPDFDKILLGILKKDKKSKIILVKDNLSIYRKLKKRLLLRNPDIHKRIFFLNRGNKNFYISLCSLSSVLLDPLHFGSGTTFYESMTVGAPTISLPGVFLRSRTVKGFYDQMQIDTKLLIANNIDDYIDKSIFLANNIETNLELRKELRECARKKLFENKKVIDEFNDLFQKIL